MTITGIVPTNVSAKRGLNGASSAEKLEDEHDGRDHQQQPDEAAADVADQAQEPQDQQDDDDRPEHRILLNSFRSPGRPGRKRHCETYRSLRASRAAKRSLPLRASLLDDLVHEENRRSEQEEVDPLAQTQKHAGQPQDQGDRGQDPDHGIGSRRTTKASTPSTTRSISDATRTLAASTGRSSFTPRAPP